MWSACESAEFLDAVLRLEGRARLGLFVGHGELLAPARDLALPGAGVGLDRAGGEHRLDLGDDLLDDVLGVADDRHVGSADLALLGGVDVDMDDLGLLGERVDPAGDPVVEAGAERDQQVAALERGDGRGVAVHARHAEAQRMLVGERAAGHQRGDDVDVGQLGELTQRLGGT